MGGPERNGGRLDWMTTRQHYQRHRPTLQLLYISLVYLWDQLAAWLPGLVSLAWIQLFLGIVSGLSPLRVP